MKKIVCGAMLLTAVGVCADLPVTEVVLYKNGIGYFVRSGEVKSGETAALQFKAGEMNDVLKSLTITDAGGGKVSGLHYDSSEPIETRLAEYPFKMADRQPISALLDQLRGARVEFRTGPEAVSGLLMGARVVAASQSQTEREQATVLVDSGELRTVELAGITAVRFSNAALQGQLKQYLGEVAAGRSKEKRTVWIDSIDGRPRNLTASYVTPAPVWKSSYRLLFTDVAEPTLEGWAIVDNTTGEDWSKVHLALVSGRPVSFVSNLYAPKHLERQEAALAEEEAAAPEVYEASAAGAPGGVIGGVVSNVPTRLPPPPPPPPAPAPMQRAFAKQKSFERTEIVPSSVERPTDASERGELFEYRFSQPVTVPGGQSAMLPFLQQKIGARKLLIFSTAATDHPRNAVEITNSTGKTLDGGPITIFDGNTYAGEALMATLKGGDKRLVSYAIDLGTTVTTRLDNSSNLVREIHLARGILTVRSAIEETKTYTVRNVDRKPKTLVIEHAIRPNYRLIKMKPAETAANAYRFEVKLGAGASEKFPVTEEQLLDQTIAVVNASPDFLLSWQQNKVLTDTGRKQLESIAGQKSRIAETNNDIQRASEQVNEIVRDQDRLRQNINSLNAVHGQQDQVQKYASQLATQETQLAALRDRQSELRKKKAALETELNKMIETAEF